MAEQVRSPRPREVPGFAKAVAAGLTPARPARPPALLPGTTAHQALVRCALVLACAVVLVVVVIAFGPEDGGQATVWGVASILGATAVGLAPVLVAIGRFRRVLLAELAAGYVTTTFLHGSFWFVSRPGRKVGNDVVGWDWDGVWVLTSGGSVVTAPDPGVDPPGFYPSPHRPGELELWTGCQWIGVHQTAPAERR